MTQPASSPSRADHIKKSVGKVLKIALPTALSLLLVWWLLSKIDIHRMMGLIHHNVRWGWVIAMMLITTLSHIIRGYRWGLQLEGIGVHENAVALAVSIFGTYALNLLIPRGGEVWRCVYITRRDDVKMSRVVGTLLGDRASDLVAILIIAAVALVVAFPAFRDFMEHYSFGREIVNWTESPLRWCVLAAICGGAWALFHFFRHTKFVTGVDNTVNQMWQGFKVLFTLRQPWLYVWLTVGIWVCYFSETYTMFYAFPFTRALVHEPGMDWGMLPGIVVFVFGSFSMAVPSNGGLGAWNLAVMFGLSLYGIDNTEGATFSIVMWSAQALMLLILGIFSAIYVMRTSKAHRAAVIAARNH